VVDNGADDDANASVVEGGLVQVNTDQLIADNTFTLCTACGDVFIIHVSLVSHTDVTFCGRSVHNVDILLITVEL